MISTSFYFVDRNPYEYSHQVPLPSELNGLMSEFLDWFNGNAAISLHPVERAVMTYLNLMFIHPFVGKFFNYCF